MLKQFTSGTLLLLCLNVAGCAQIPLGSSASNTEVEVTAPAERTLPLADESMLTAQPIEVESPPGWLGISAAV